MSTLQLDLRSRLKPTRQILSGLLPDRLYIQLLYRKTYGQFPNLKHPSTFDEKIQWYKLYYRSPLMTRMADKYAVRSYLEEKGFSRILNQLYGVYEASGEIDFAGLPQSFAIKATHGSSMNIICKDKRSLDWTQQVASMNRWLQLDYYRLGREWAYKNMRRRLICERYLENPEISELIDYKFYCYDNKPEVLFVCTNRFGPGGVRYDAFDMNLKRLPVSKGKPTSPLETLLPGNIEQMIQTAADLSAGFPFVRVDLYSIKGKIYFGEFTFYPDMGLGPFSPDYFNHYFGDLFRLPPR